MERCTRQAVAADPRCAVAHAALATVLFGQGKMEDGSQEIHEALKLQPELASAHCILGVILLSQDKPEAAVKELREAIRLDPDAPDILVRLAEYHASQGEWMPALSGLEEARRLNPVAADVFAHMGYYYAHQGERAKALRALKDAEFLGLEDGNAEQMTSQAYDRLHEVALAVAHYEKLMTLMRGQGMNPTMVNDIARRLQQLKDSLKPVFVNAAEPQAYSEPSLREALQLRLSAEELASVNFPLTSTPEMKRWAEDLTRGAADDLQKARALYEALARHLDPGPGGSKTARETYADWRKPQASFRCQEYARLYVALARDAGLKAYFVIVDRDFEDKVVLHACAGVWIEGQALLVDPTYQWFGVPHKQFVLQDDYQAVVSQLNQSGDLARNRLAVKLQPGSALSQFNLAARLMFQDQWNEARLVLQTALKLDAESWMAHGSQGLLAQHDGQPERALTHLRKAVEMYPLDATIHYALALVLWEQQQLREAREEFRACLKYRPFANQQTTARHAIALINEKLGSENEP
jgi:tetratricopeptide (TPR) repeat protein